MSEYLKECIFCKEKILMSDQKGKWLPFNQDGLVHECKKNGQNIGKVTTQDPTTHKEITLATVLRKLESIGIKVNLEELFK